MSTLGVEKKEMNNRRVKRILVTGGTGFIRKHLVKKLSQGRKSTDIVCLVREGGRAEDVAFLERLGVVLR